MAKIANYILNLPSAVCEKHLKNSGFSDTPMQQKKIVCIQQIFIGHIKSSRKSTAMYDVLMSTLASLQKKTLET
jgi:hypothetical protein